jgi:hypothetical protein
MFPDTTMTKQELTDTLAYLALLRHEGSLKSQWAIGHVDKL